MTNIVGAPDERLEDKDTLITDLEEKCEELERKLFKTQQEFKESGEKRRSASSKKAPRGRQELERVSPSISATATPTTRPSPPKWTRSRTTR